MLSKIVFYFRVGSDYKVLVINYGTGLLDSFYSISPAQAHLSFPSGLFMASLALNSTAAYFLMKNSNTQMNLITNTSGFISNSYINVQN